MYGREFTQSRAVTVYAPRALTMKYSGTTVAAHHPLPPSLQRMWDRVEMGLGVRFSAVMLNRYDDGSVYIG